MFATHWHVWHLNPQPSGYKVDLLPKYRFDNLFFEPTFNLRTDYSINYVTIFNVHQSSGSHGNEFVVNSEMAAIDVHLFMG